MAMIGGGGTDSFGGFSGSGGNGGDGGSYSDMLSVDTSSFTLDPKTGEKKDQSVEEAQKELSFQLQRQGIKSFGKGIAAVSGILIGVATGNIAAAVGFGALVGKVFSKESVQRAIASIQSGKSPAVVAAGLVESNGGRAEVEKNLQDADSFGQISGNGGGGNDGLTKNQLNPKSNAFWKDFVKEWQGAKESLEAQQQYRQEQLEPAFETYKNRLSGLSSEAGFRPINVGMGDFSTSFLPKRSSENAERILRGELSRTDIMDPERANLSYLDRLLGVAQFQQDLKSKRQQRELPEDQGTWLDAASDTLGLASQASDFIDKIF